MASQMVLTWRYSAATRAFLARVSAIEPFGGHAANITGAMLGGYSPPRGGWSAVRSSTSAPT